MKQKPLSMTPKTKKCFNK